MRTCCSSQPESTDSDYDVRFIYLSQLKDYLTVYPRRDVIANCDIISPDPLLDFSGWDFRKFLGLVSKSNPVALSGCSPTSSKTADFVK